MTEAGSLESAARNIIKERLLSIPEELKTYVPPILLRKDLDFFSKTTSEYFLFVCLDNEKRALIEQRQKDNGDPFPHLITTYKVKKHMFTVDKAMNIAVGEMTLDVRSGHAFYVGKDSTLLLYNIRQKGIDKILGEFHYDIDVAFIISFGEEIRQYNLLDFFEALIAYAFKIWKSGHEPRKPA